MAAVSFVLEECVLSDICPCSSSELDIPRLWAKNSSLCKPKTGAAAVVGVWEPETATCLHGFTTSEEMYSLLLLFRLWTLNEPLDPTGRSFGEANGCLSGDRCLGRRGSSSISCRGVKGGGRLVTGEPVTLPAGDGKGVMLASSAGEPETLEPVDDAV